MKKFYNVKLFVLIFTFFFSTTSFAFQYDKVQFDRVSLEWGLSSTTITTIVQDSRGYIWAGTNNGLDMFDGSWFEIFKTSPFDSLSISTNSISSIAEDSSGNIWVGTLGGGLNKFEMRTKKFKRFNLTPGSQNTLGSNNISVMTIDKLDNIWIGTQDNGLVNYDHMTDKFIQFDFENVENGNLVGKNIKSLLYNPEENTLLIGSSQSGLVKFDIEKNELTNLPLGLGTRSPTAILKGSGDEIWVGTSSGLFKYSNDDEKFIRTSFGNEKLSYSISSLEEDARGNLWIGTKDNGVFIRKSITGEFTHLEYNSADKFSLSSNKILDMFEDNTGIMWIGTDKGALSTWDSRYPEFSLMKFSNKEDSSIDIGYINTVLEGPDGRLWIGHENGIDILKNRDVKNREIFYSLNFSENYDTDITTFKIIGDEYVWIGTTATGLIRINIKSKKTEIFSNDPANPNSLSSNHVTYIYEDNNQTIWIGTWNSGLNRWNSRTKDFTSYKNIVGDEESISGNNITTIFEDSDYTLWIGTLGAGLNNFSKTANSFHRYGVSTPPDKGTVFSIIEDADNNLWLGAGAGGLTKFDKSAETFQQFNDYGYLSEDRIFNLIYDNSGLLWLATDKRLAKYDMSKNKFMYFDPYYWLESNEISANAAFKDDTGELYFGGVLGISHFNPANLSKNDEIPQLNYIKVKIGEIEYHEFDIDPITNYKTITVPHTSDYVEFDYLIVDHRYAYNNRYASYFEGKDDAWEYGGNFTSLYYDNLSPGTYTFKLKGANHFGVWNEEVVPIQIIITPPFWKTKWFYAFILFVGLGLVYIVDKNRVNSIKQRNLELEEKVRARTEEIIHHQNELEHAKANLEFKIRERTVDLSKKNEQLEDEINKRHKAEEGRKSLETQLFQSQKMELIGRLAGGIAHDFNNILASIMGYADLLKFKYGEKESDEKEAAEIIFRMSKKASDLTKQLLGFARGGKYNPVSVNVNKVLLESMKVNEKIFQKNVRVNYKLSKRAVNVVADCNQLENVFTNILFNANDSMPEGGYITIETDVVKIEKSDANNFPGLTLGEYVAIEFSDTGAGMTNEVAKQIFDPFFTTKGKTKGSGLGLAMVYGIIKNHHGFIYCTSEIGVGSVFTILLPISAKEEVSITNGNSTLVLGSGNILIIDDELELRRSLVAQIKRLGYNAFDVGDGVLGVEFYKENRKNIDLILLDMLMPNMAGKETFFELKKIDKDARVVIYSGYSQDDKANEILENGGLGFVQKPMDLQQLSQLLSKYIKKQ